jgi:hypothetical protein
MAQLLSTNENAFNFSSSQWNLKKSSTSNHVWIGIILAQWKLKILQFLIMWGWEFLLPNESWKNLQLLIMWRWEFPLLNESWKNLQLPIMWRWEFPLLNESWKNLQLPSMWGWKLLFSSWWIHWIWIKFLHQFQIS